MGVKRPKTDLSSLKPKPCRHPKNYVKTEWNRKGQEFKECDKCEAFLGFTGRRR